jgi:hypothetical protein
LLGLLADFRMQEMTSMHQIKVDTPNAMLEVRITGFWTVDDVAQFGRDMVAATSGFLASGRHFVTLYDYTGAIIQSQDVVAAFQALALATPARSQRAALFTEGGVARMQARRIASVRPEEMRAFEDRAAALAWLSQEEAVPALRRAAR